MSRGYDNWHLITVIVERWRSETHTFHLTSGEVTITLQDVNILSGLRVDGNAVTGNTGYDWPVFSAMLEHSFSSFWVVAFLQANLGSAALAWLYRELCRASRERMHDISDFLILVQIWAWYRFPHIAPHRLLRQPITDGPFITRTLIPYPLISNSGISADNLAPTEITSAT
ncbi:hypothetical protein ACSBR1_005187 [Camellia fascicularis]